MKILSFFYYLRRRFFAQEVSLSDLSREQARVMQGYKDSGAVKTPADEEALHMFFSPRRVSPGMTAGEVRVCISLYPLRRQQIEYQRRTEGVLAPMMRPIPLPPEFRTDKNMSRRRFRIGIRKFLRIVLETEGFFHKEGGLKCAE